MLGFLELWAIFAKELAKDAAKDLISEILDTPEGKEKKQKAEFRKAMNLINGVAPDVQVYTSGGNGETIDVPADFFESSRPKDGFLAHVMKSRSPTGILPKPNNQRFKEGVDVMECVAEMQKRFDKDNYLEKCILVVDTKPNGLETFRVLYSSRQSKRWRRMFLCKIRY